MEEFVHMYIGIFTDTRDTTDPQYGAQGIATNDKVIRDRGTNANILS